MVLKWGGTLNTAQHVSHRQMWYHWSFCSWSHPRQSPIVKHRTKIEKELQTHQRADKLKSDLFLHLKLVCVWVSQRECERKLTLIYTWLSHHGFYMCKRPVQRQSTPIRHLIIHCPVLPSVCVCVFVFACVWPAARALDKHHSPIKCTN